MKTLHTSLILIILMSFAFISSAQDVSLNTIKLKYDSSLLEKQQGIAILTKKEGRTETLSLGAHNLNKTSVFNIGSATKTFTAILILQEIEKGNLTLSDSIGGFLPPIKNVPSSLTIKELLAHESGLDEIIGKNILNIFFGKNDSLYDISLLKQLEAHRPKERGTFSYCNTNYFLLGKVLEKVTDQSYFDLVQERIIEPLGLKNTYPYLHKNIENLAQPRHEDKNVSEYLDFRYFTNIAYAAGSIASTLTDMELFYTSLFETEQLLKKETLQLMMTKGNDHYGLGLMKSSYHETILYGHGGNNIGYAFRNEYNPKTKTLYLAFTNTKTLPFQKAITTDLKAYVTNEPIKPTLAIDIETFRDFIGTYYLEEAKLVLEIIEEGNKLYLLAEAQGVKSELIQKNKSTLFDTTVGATLERLEDSDAGLKFSQNGFETLIKRRGKK